MFSVPTHNAEDDMTCISYSDPAAIEISKSGSPDLDSYDHILVAFSGGKDSLSCLLHLFEQGVDRSRVELWHHDVDGPTSGLMDWPVTRDYCRKVAEALDVPIFFSWREGGFEGEMLKENSFSGRIRWENTDGTLGISKRSSRAKQSTRRKFPQVSANLAVRWCSAYLKVDVMTAAVRGQERFNGKRVLVVTGERAEESASRAKYATMESHKANAQKRTVDAWRPVHSWKEEEVWAIIERHAINPHPAYRLGWGRVSCMACIFGSKDQWSTIRRLDPERFEKIAAYEREFDCTIQRDKSVVDMADSGTPYEYDENIAAVAMSDNFNEPVIVSHWTLPAGAFGDSAGPS